MRCGKAEKLLSVRLDNELNRAMVQKLDEHLEGCAHCRKEEQELLAMRKLFSAKARVEPDDFFWTRLSARIRAVEARPRIFDFSKAAVRFAAVSLGVLALVAAIYFALSQREEPTQTYTPPGNNVVAPFQSETVLFANDEITDEELLRLAIDPKAKVAKPKAAVPAKQVRPAVTRPGASVNRGTYK
jgi:anti-sigma factor RsiW